MRRLFLAIAFTLIASVAQAQTNPCTSPIGTTSANPTTVYVQHVDMLKNQPDGTPVIATVKVGVFLVGVNPQTGAPVTSVDLPRSAFTPVAGAANCYVTKLAQPLAVPTFTPHVGAAQAINPFGASAWVLSNPFFAAGAPSEFNSVRVQ
jgi:hypothetical protein